MKEKKSIIELNYKDQFVLINIRMLLYKHNGFSY